MLICHLTSVHPYNDVRIFTKQSCSEASAGHEVHLIAPGAPEGEQNGVRLHSVPRNYKNRLERMTKTVWAVYHVALSVKADLYVFHDPELIPVGMLLRAYGNRVVYDIHEDVPRDVLSKEYLGWARWPLSWPIECLENMASRHFSALVAATPTIGARFQALNPQTVVANNYPVRDDLVFLPATAWNRRLCSVAYVGGISAIRGSTQMVEAMEYVPKHLRATLELIGPFASSEEHDRVVKLRGWAHVNEHGVLGRDQVAQLLGKVRAGLVLFHPAPNHVNAQPNKLFEYMSVGIPVIASDFPLWRKQVEPIGCGLLVDPLDTRAIANAIEFVLTYPEEAEAMGRRGREAVEKHYNWESEFSKLLQLYECLVRT